MMLHNIYKINSIYPLSSIIFETNIEVHYETATLIMRLMVSLKIPDEKFTCLDISSPPFSPAVKRLAANFLLREVNSREARLASDRGVRTGVKGLKERNNVGVQWAPLAPTTKKNCPRRRDSRESSYNLKQGFC